MRISDWSSDVCSSDLIIAHPRLGPFARALLVPRRRAHDLCRKFGRDHRLAPDREREIHRLESLHIILPVTTLFVKRHETVTRHLRQRPATHARPPPPPPRPGRPGEPPPPPPPPP